MIRSAKTLANQKPYLDLTGPQGNAYYILAEAKSLSKQLGIDFEPILKEMTSGDYENLVQTFDKHFGDFVDLYR